MHTAYTYTYDNLIITTSPAARTLLYILSNQVDLKGTHIGPGGRALTLLLESKKKKKRGRGKNKLPKNTNTSWWE
jgi:hypothetical protein